MQNETDQVLLERARAGDAGALEALLERHQAQIYRFGMKMCGDPEDAKDVLQETLLAMARNVGDFRGASSLSTWLYSIARSYCIKKRRKSKFAPAEHSMSEAASEARQLADPGKRPDENLASRQVEQALERAIDALDSKYRDVLVLRDVEGLTAPEVAEVLGVGVQAVKSRLHRARLSVRAEIAPLLEIPPAATGPRPENCPEVLELFSRHLEDEISAESCAEMEKHLHSCDYCRGACDSLKRTLAMCRTAGMSVEVPEKIRKSLKVALRDFLSEKS
jgi:RNA polymerase sigma-70 factor (ECF subfamily)